MFKSHLVNLGKRLGQCVCRSFGGDFELVFLSTTSTLVVLLYPQLRNGLTHARKIHHGLTVFRFRAECLSLAIFYYQNLRKHYAAFNLTSWRLNIYRPSRLTWYIA